MAADRQEARSAACTCGERDAERYPDATDRVIVPSAADCPIHGVSAATTLFQPRVEEGTIDLMVSDGPKRCICCPPHHQHVFAYGHALPGKSAGGYPRHADDLVRDVLHEAFRKTADAAAVNRMRVRVTVELLPEEES